MSDLQGLQVPTLNWSNKNGLHADFQRFKQRCQLIFDSALAEKSEAVQARYLVLWSGNRGLDEFNSWGLSEEDKGKLDVLWERFEGVTKPQSNEVLAAFEFSNLRQTADFDSFLTKARLLLQDCNFPTAAINDRMLRDLIVRGCSSDKVRTRCIAEGNGLTLIKAITLARVCESADQQSKYMSAQSHQTGVEVDAVQHQPWKRRQPETAKGMDHRAQSNRVCMRCGFETHKEGKTCPAIGKPCNYCKKIGHFSSICQKKKRGIPNKPNIGTLEDAQDVAQPAIEHVTPDDDFYIHVLEIDTVSEQRPRSKFVGLTVTAENNRSATLRVKLDCGAEVNALPMPLFQKLASFNKNIKLDESKQCTVRGHENRTSRTHGSTDIPIKIRDKTMTIPFQVTNSGRALLGLVTCEDLQLIAINQRALDELDITTAPLTEDKVRTEFKDIFGGLGTFPGPEYHIELVDNARPVVHPPRVVPVHIQPEFKRQLDDMEKTGVIAKVTEPTEWVNSIVLVHKRTADDKIKLRICLDPRDLNKFIRREHYPTRTIDDVIPRIKDATLFTICDASKGYWMVILDYLSSLLTVFNTPFGRYRFLRLPFGIVVSQDIFLRKLDEVYGELPGIITVADDIFVHGATEVEHDRHLLKLLHVTRKNGLKLNAEKLQFKRTEVAFFGHTWTLDGLKPDKQKIAAITEMKPPNTVLEVQSFLGLVNYLTRFSPSLAAISEPIRTLTRKDVHYHWDEPQCKAFEEIKKIITSVPTLAYYDPQLETTVQTDASLKGLGAALMQEGKPVCYASRVLTGAERNYSNIERELLGTVWGLRRFNHYTFGKTVRLETDHKPLEALAKKGIALAPPRLQRMLLQMAHYDVTVIYVPGKHLCIADALSRVDPLQIDEHEVCIDLIEEGNMQCHIPASGTVQAQIKNMTSSDPELQALSQTIYEGWPPSRNQVCPTTASYWTYRDEMSLEDGIVYKGNRAVIPAKMRSSMLEKIHAGHLGEEKCLLRARSSIFWPGITTEIRFMVKDCSTCQEHQNAPAKLPTLHHEVPPAPWVKLAMDLFTWKTQKYLLCVDYYSKYPAVKRIEDETSLSTAKAVMEIFSEFGVPVRVVSDNGPAFVGQEFKALLTKYDVQHITSSPTYPQGNAMAERFVQTVKSLFTKAAQNDDCVQAALLIYRTTPVSSTIPSPLEILTSRPARSNLPFSTRHLSSRSNPEWQSHLQRTNLCDRQEESNCRPGPARYYDTRSATWKQCAVQGPVVEPRSLQVGFPSGRTTRRTSRHIREAVHPGPAGAPTSAAAANAPISQITEPAPSISAPSNSAPSSSPEGPKINREREAALQVHTTRSGRTTKVPEKFK